MNAVLPRQYDVCLYAPCFLYSLISIKSNLNASQTRPLSRVETLWSHAIQAGTKNPDNLSAPTPRPGPRRFMHSPPSPALGPNSPLFSIRPSRHSFLLPSVISNPDPCSPKFPWHVPSLRRARPMPLHPFSCQVGLCAVCLSP